MAEEGGQKRKFARRILIGSIPAHERACCESVSQIVQARSTTVGCAAQTDLPGQGIERSMNVSTIQPIAPAGDEQVGGHRTLPPVAFAPADVVCEHFAGRGMQRYQAGLAELGAADGQQCFLEIDILKLEVACFAEAQALVVRRGAGPQDQVVHHLADLAGAGGAQMKDVRGKGAERRPCAGICVRGSVALR